MGVKTKSVREIIPREVESLLSMVDVARRDASVRLDSQRRALMGQFLTPVSVAKFMARMVE